MEVPLPLGMALKLTSRQQAQLAYLQLLPPKIARIRSVIEQMGALQADEHTVRGLGRLLDEIKAHAQSLSMNGIAESCGLMGTMSRRGGGLQVKVRGLRELLGSLQINYDAAVKAASTPEREPAGE